MAYSTTFSSSTEFSTNWVTKNLSTTATADVTTNTGQLTIALSGARASYAYLEEIPGVSLDTGFNGNFELQFDAEIPCSSTYVYLSIAFCILTGGYPWTFAEFYLGCQNNEIKSWGSLAATNPSNYTSNSGTPSPYPSSTGRFKLVRSGNTFTLTYKPSGGSSFDALGGTYGAIADQMTSSSAGKLRLSLRGPSGAYVKIDNLEFVSGGPDIVTTPAAPTSPSATGGNKKVTVSWTASSGATSYNLYRGTSTGVTTANGTKIEGVSSGYEDTGRDPNTTYYYIVTAVNGNGESTASSETSAATNAAPSAPTGLSGTGGAKKVTLSWSSSSGATSYNLYRGTSTGVTKANGTKIASVTSPYEDTGRATNTTYYYVVTAESAAGESADSSEASATTSAAPAAPTGVAASGGDELTSILWNSVAGATSYNIYWKTTTGVTTANGTKITGATSPYTHTGRSNGTTYYYIVTAESAAGESTASSEVSAATNPAPLPNAPAGVAAVPGASKVTVSWGAAANATSYNLYWSLQAGVAGTKISGVTSPYEHTGRAGGVTYYYVVTAENGTGESQASTQVAAAVVAAPSAPTGLTATTGREHIHLSWTASAGATSYKLYFSEETGVTTETGQVIEDIVSTSYTHQGLTAGTELFYIVTAVNTGGESAASSEDSATPTAALLSHSFTLDGLEVLTIRAGALVPGQILALGTFHFVATDEYDATSYELAVTLANRTASGTNAQGFEMSDEKWIEASDDGVSWTPIGGGIDGTTFSMADETDVYLRLNTPAGVTTCGDICANIEIVYKD
jgi:hypothetical protein